MTTAAPWGSRSRVASSPAGAANRQGWECELGVAAISGVPIQRTFRLEQAGEALQALPSADTQGKLGLTIG